MSLAVPRDFFVFCSDATQQSGMNLDKKLNFVKMAALNSM